MKLITNYSYRDTDKAYHFDFYLCESHKEYQQLRSTHIEKEVKFGAISREKGYEFDAVGIHCTPCDGHHTYYIKPGTITKPSYAI